MLSKAISVLGEAKTEKKIENLFANLESNEIANVMMMKRRMPVAKRRLAC